MAERGIDPNEEKKSYGSIFVIGIGLLVAFSFWAFWDDNITRRPWKNFQSRFYRLDYAKAQAAYDEENKKLQADANYQELSKKLTAARASVQEGELGAKLDALEAEEVRATVRFQEIDQEVKFIKSELEEAGYEYDHAIQQKRNPKPYQERLQELEKERAKLDPQLEAARSKRDQIKEEIKKIHAGVKDLESELGKLTAERDKWVRVMENATFKLGPFSFYKIPKIQQVSLEEFDRNRFDQPIARVDRCQTCHMAINRAGFEKEEHPFKTHPRREVLLADNAHPPDKLGCTSCHDGQGVAVSSVNQAHGEVHYWEHPLLRGAKVQSSCTTCHLDVQKFQDTSLLTARADSIRTGRLYRMSPGQRIREYSQDRSQLEKDQCQGGSELDGEMDPKPAQIPAAHAHAQLRSKPGRRYRHRRLPLVGLEGGRRSMDPAASFACRLPRKRCESSRQRQEAGGDHWLQRLPRFCRG